MKPGNPAQAEGANSRSDIFVLGDKKEKKTSSFLPGRGFLFLKKGDRYAKKELRRNQ
jgi:hypothetical protein